MLIWIIVFRHLDASSVNFRTVKNLFLGSRSGSGASARRFASEFQ
jgi:hypothetical protein